MSTARQRLAATIETLLRFFDDEQADRVCRFAISVASERGPGSLDVETARAERDDLGAPS